MHHAGLIIVGVLAGFGAFKVLTTETRNIVGALLGGLVLICVAVACVVAA